MDAVDAMTGTHPAQTPREPAAPLGSTGPLAALDAGTLERLRERSTPHAVEGRALLDAARGSDVLVVARGELLVLRSGTEPGQWIDSDGACRDERGELVATDPVTGMRVVGRLGEGDVVGSPALQRHELEGAVLRACTSGVTVVTIDSVDFHLELARTLLACTELSNLEPGKDVDVRRTGLYNDLPMRDLALVLRDARIEQFDADEAIVQQGELGDRFHVVLDGELSIVRDGMHAGTLLRGDHFGELALLRDAPRAATVRAATWVRTWSITRASFDALLRHRLGPGADVTARDLADGRGPGGAWGSPLAARLRAARR